MTPDDEDKRHAQNIHGVLNMASVALAALFKKHHLEPDSRSATLLTGKVPWSRDSSSGVWKFNLYRSDLNLFLTVEASVDLLTLTDEGLTGVYRCLFTLEHELPDWCDFGKKARIYGLLASFYVDLASLYDKQRITKLPVSTLEEQKQKAIQLTRQWEDPFLVSLVTLWAPMAKAGKPCSLPHPRTDNHVVIPWLMGQHTYILGEQSYLVVIKNLCTEISLMPD